MRWHLNGDVGTRELVHDDKVRVRFWPLPTGGWSVHIRPSPLDEAGYDVMAPDISEVALKRKLEEGVRRMVKLERRAARRSA